MDTPSMPINHVPAKTGETFMLGTVRIRIMEDGSRTDRIGSAEFTLPPHTPGPPPHWHEMHDETFLTTQGTVRFHGLGGANIDAALGDYVTVPPRAPHTFSNPFDQEAKFFNTYTPAFYIEYFRMLGKMGGEGKPMDPEKNRKAMAYFATIGVKDDEMQMDKQQFYGNGESSAEAKSGADLPSIIKKVV